VRRGALGRGSIFAARGEALGEEKGHAQIIMEFFRINRNKERVGMQREKCLSLKIAKLKKEKPWKKK